MMMRFLISCTFLIFVFQSLECVGRDWNEVENVVVNWACSGELNDASVPAEFFYFSRKVKQASDDQKHSIKTQIAPYLSEMLLSSDDPRYQDWQREEKKARLLRLQAIYNAADGDSEAMEKYLEMRGQVSDGTEAFFEAVRSGDIEGVGSYLEDGGDINALSEDGMTALHVVESVPLATYLVEKGADVDALETQALMTPLFFQDGDIMKLLIERGANIHATSTDGNTPLLWYGYSSYEEGIRLLIKMGADFHHKNTDGRTVIDILKDFGNPDLYQRILEESDQPKST